MRERISRLNSASLRISASLDVETVLQEVVESACALTLARRGVIATIDQSGQPIDFLTSGLTVEERRLMIDWPDGVRLFDHLRELPGALRLPDVQVYVSSLGFSPDVLPFGTFLGHAYAIWRTACRQLFSRRKGGRRAFHRRRRGMPRTVRVAGCHSDCQCPCTYREEQRARADLEALVETSPVGVVVV